METLLFLIIIGIISTIFRKGKKPMTKYKPFSKNTFEDTRAHFQNEPVKTKFKHSKQNNEKDIEKAYQKVKQKMATGSTVNHSQEKPAETSQKARVDHNVVVEETAISVEPTPQKVINGIIWAEILGEPRSKKTFYAKKGGG